MKIKITYLNGYPWDSKPKELTATSEGDTIDEAMKNFYISPEGKLSPKTILNVEEVNPKHDTPHLG